MRLAVLALALIVLHDIRAEHNRHFRKRPPPPPNSRVAQPADQPSRRGCLRAGTTTTGAPPISRTSNRFPRASSRRPSASPSSSGSFAASTIRSAPLSRSARRQGRRCQARDHDRRSADDEIGPRIDEQMNYGKWVRSSNWVRYTLTRRLEEPPGTSMEYSTGNSHLLSAILTKATKRSTWHYAQEVLAKPLGFTLARWMQDPQGIYFGGNEMMLTPRQMLAFGELPISGTRVVSRSSLQWVKDSFVPRGKSDYSDQMYGYGWWMRAGRRAGVLCVGLRRPAHLRRPAASARRRDDIIDRDRRRTPQSPAQRPRSGRGAHHRPVGGVLGLSSPSVNSM